MDEDDTPSCVLRCVCVPKTERWNDVYTQNTQVIHDTRNEEAARLDRQRQMRLG